MEIVFRLALLCCFTVGMISGEETKGGRHTSKGDISHFQFKMQTAPEAEADCEHRSKSCQAESSCDNCSQLATDGKYFLYNVKLNWYQAIELCAQMGKRPATFNNETEYNQLVKLIRDNFPDNDPTGDFWTAGSDLGVYNSYIWLSTGRSLLFTKWGEASEPNHSKSTGEVEHCIELRAQYDYKMNDRPCSTKSYVACEREPCCCT